MEPRRDCLTRQLLARLRPPAAWDPSATGIVVPNPFGVPLDDFLPGELGLRPALEGKRVRGLAPPIAPRGLGYGPR